MKFKHCIAALLFLGLLCPLPLAGHASEVPDESKKGSITVEMEYNGKPVTDGTLSAYYVGSIQESDGSYSFVKTPELVEFSGDYANVTTPKLAEDLAAFVKERKLTACAQAENKDGKAVLSELELGLYLIVQTQASKGFDPVNPFLVSVPMNQGGKYVYDVNADGKFQLHQESKPTDPPLPPIPTDPKLPQTGQLNWPIPVLAVIGLLLFSAGWILRYGNQSQK